MITPADFESQARSLARLNGISLDRAEDLLSLIGDTPELSDDGRVVVRDQAGTEIAKLWIETED